MPHDRWRPNFSTCGEQFLDTRYTPCSIHHGAGRVCCPPSNWPDLDASGRATELHFNLQPLCHPLVSVPGRMRRLFVPEQSGMLSHWAMGDLVCPSGQTGCCSKQRRSISDGISPSAPAGLRERAIAGYQHQQRHHGGSLQPSWPRSSHRAQSRESVCGPNRGSEWEDSGGGPLGTAPPKLWLIDCEISGPVCSACLVQLWEDFQLWNNLIISQRKCLPMN